MTAPIPRRSGIKLLLNFFEKKLRESRGQSPLVLSAQDAAPARGAVRTGRRPGGGLQLRKEVVAKRQDCIVYQRDAHLG